MTTNSTIATQISKIQDVACHLAQINQHAQMLRAEYDLWEGKADEYVREVSKRFVREMLTEWAEQNAPYLPENQIEAAMAEAARASHQAGMEQLFRSVIQAWEADGHAQQLSRQQRESDLSSLVPVNYHHNDEARAKLRPNKLCLRVSISFYEYGFSIYRAAPALRLLAEVINAELKPAAAVDLVTAVQQAQTDHQLGQKYATQQASVPFIKTSQSRTLTLWFETAEAADKVAAVLLEARKVCYAAYKAQWPDRSTAYRDPISQAGGCK